jgi:hypothetical protein
MGKEPKHKRHELNPVEQMEALEVEWLRIGLTGPARKALVEAKLYKVSDMRKISLEELRGLSGVSKSAIARIQVIMRAKKISFRD